MYKDNDRYTGRFCLTFPTIKKSQTDCIFGEGGVDVVDLSFPTTFRLTNNKTYCKIELSLLGFGILIELKTRGI